MSEQYPVPPRVREGSSSPLSSLSAYREASARAVADPDAFWLEVTRRRIAWMTPPTLGLEGRFHDVSEGPLRWFGDGVLNVTESCLDRHAAATPGSAIFIINSPSKCTFISKNAPCL